MDEPRCARGTDCQDREPGTDPATGEPAFVGAPTEHDIPLCPTCVRYTRYALGSLPLDVAELTVLMHPAQEIRYRDPNLPDQPRVKKHAPLPIDGQAEALRAYIDHEALLWARAVVVASGETWDDEWSATTRIGYRVQHATTLLADNTLLMLALPAARRPVYSTGVDRADGHDLDDVTTNGRDVWADRDGLDAALTFLSIHRQVEGFAGRIPADRLALPCPRCHLRSLVREHHRSLTDPRTGEESQGRVVCRGGCWHQMTDGGYEELRAATARAFGVSL